MKTLIIGGVAAGASCAARLRRLDEGAEIVILERGEFISFANCALPYYIGEDITEKESLTLQTPAGFKSRFNIDVRIFSEAIAVNTESKTVTVRNARTGEQYEEPYDSLVLAPGAAPVIPNIEGVECDRVFTLRSIPDTLKIKAYIDRNHPKSAVIIGGGYIGVEMAENLVKAGIQVSIVEFSDHLISSLDFDMAADMHRYMRSKGINLVLKSRVTAIKKDGDCLSVESPRGKISADMVILAVGVRADTAFLSNSGIELNERGAITVNSRMQTNLPSVYAAGDAAISLNYVTQTPTFAPLAGPANKQGRIVADNICGIPSEYKGTQGSSILKFLDMTVATTGLNETAVKNAGFDYGKAYTYSASHAAYYPGASMLSVKLIWEKKSLKILGAEIVGFDGVDKRADVIATAIRFGGKVTDLTELEFCYAPPFSSAKDPVNMVGFVAENTVTGKVGQFFWHDVEGLPRNGSVTLLDTRTPAEFSRGRIDGFINIPLDSLRSRIGEIPKDKPVYVHCHSGHRSYIACRILAGYGFECYNLAGGWRLYESVMNELSNLEN